MAFRFSDKNKPVEKQKIYTGPMKIECNGMLVFTPKDVVEIANYIEDNDIHDMEGLVEYLEGKVGCNRLLKYLKLILEQGIAVKPKYNIRPITEKCLVENGKFKISYVPLLMGTGYFVANLVVVRLLDENGKLTNQYEMFDDVEVDDVNLVCTIPDSNIKGIASVTYFTVANN